MGVINFLDIPKYQQRSRTIRSDFKETELKEMSKVIKGGAFKVENEKYILKLIDNMCDNNRDLKKDIVESEKRVAENIKLSEERMEKKFDSILKAIEKSNDRVETKITEIEAKSDNSLKWVVGTCIATLIGVATMVITVILTK